MRGGRQSVAKTSAPQNEASAEARLDAARVFIAARESGERRQRPVAPHRPQGSQLVGADADQRPLSGGPGVTQDVRLALEGCQRSERLIAQAREEEELVGRS